MVLTDSTPLPRVRMTAISRRFGGTIALDGVGLDAWAGEVHAVCGENGAGKSTLMNVLAGNLRADSGHVIIDGVDCRFRSPREAEAAGVRMIHQELNLVPQLDAAANIGLGREPRTRFGLLDRARMEDLAADLFSRLGAEIDPRVPVGRLRIGDQQLVEIARALAGSASVLIMDEPTSALSDAEVQRLDRVIAELKAAGTTILYISHRMDEVFRLADRISVLRDGRLVWTGPSSDTVPDRVLRAMVGRSITAPSGAKTIFTSTPQPLLSVEGLSLPRPPGSIGRPALRDISFELRHGEILGVAGLLGAGRTELLEALFGASHQVPTGVVRLEGKQVRHHHPAQAIAAGIAMVAEDRKALGLFDRMNVGANITVAHLNALARMGAIVDRREERRAVRHAIERLEIRAPGGESAVTGLSGGNQQKCLLARWLIAPPRVFLLDEPTRGIDVGAKAELYALFRQMAEHEGMGLLLTSSELPELLAVCDRILVLCDGRLTATLGRGEASEESILRAATMFDRREPSSPA
jgi:ABC-type sugar transport system ATPase subunit